MLNFTPYYDPSLLLWEIVANSISSFWKFLNYQKGCISIEVCSLLPAKTITSGAPGLPVVHLMLIGSTGFTLVIVVNSVLFLVTTNPLTKDFASD